MMTNKNWSGVKKSKSGQAVPKTARPKLPRPDGPPPECPRCHADHSHTKFCYFNNYNVNQPRYYCRACQRHWTAGGCLRKVETGAGKRNSRQARGGKRVSDPADARPATLSDSPIVTLPGEEDRGVSLCGQGDEGLGNTDDASSLLHHVVSWRSLQTGSRGDERGAVAIEAADGMWQAAKRAKVGLDASQQVTRGSHLETSQAMADLDAIFDDQLSDAMFTSHRNGDKELAASLGLHGDDDLGGLPGLEADLQRALESGQLFGTPVDDPGSPGKHSAPPHGQLEAQGGSMPPLYSNLAAPYSQAMRGHTDGAAAQLGWSQHGGRLTSAAAARIMAGSLKHSSELSETSMRWRTMGQVNGSQLSLGSGTLPSSAMSAYTAAPAGAHGSNGSTAMTEPGDAQEQSNGTCDLVKHAQATQRWLAGGQARARPGAEGALNCNTHGWGSAARLMRESDTSTARSAVHSKPNSWNQQALNDPVADISSKGGCDGAPPGTARASAPMFQAPPQPYAADSPRVSTANGSLASSQQPQQLYGLLQDRQPSEGLRHDADMVAELCASLQAPAADCSCDQAAGELAADHEHTRGPRRLEAMPGMYPCGPSHEAVDLVKQQQAAYSEQQQQRAYAGQQQQQAYGEQGQFVTSSPLSGGHFRAEDAAMYEDMAMRGGQAGRPPPWLLGPCSTQQAAHDPFLSAPTEAPIACGSQAHAHHHSDGVMAPQSARGGRHVVGHGTLGEGRAYDAGHQHPGYGGGATGRLPGFLSNESHVLGEPCLDSMVDTMLDAMLDAHANSFAMGA